MDAEPEHPTFAHEVWHGRLSFCGCGAPEEVLGKFRDALRAMENKSDFWHAEPSVDHYPGGVPTEAMQALHKAEQDACGPDEPTGWLTRYVLHAANLTEHGGSVGGSWLTDDGKRLLTFLEATPEEEWLGDED